MSTEKNIFHVGIAGLGNIALGYDLRKKGDSVFTHTKAFLKHPGFEIVFGIDPNEKRRSEFENYSQKPAYSSFLEVKNAEKRVDVVVIATPPTQRLGVLKDALIFQPKLILMEKPLADSVSEAEQICELCNNRGAALFVNYIRRCEPSVHQLKEMIRKSEYGKFLGAYLAYSGGLFNSASHFIDLLMFWFGEPNFWQVFDRIENEQQSDPRLNFCLHFGKACCIFQSINKPSYEIAKIELFFENGIIHYNDSGRSVELNKAENDPDYEGYYRIASSYKELQVEMHQYQLNVADHLYRFLLEDGALISTGETALAVIRICDDLKNDGSR